jgi:hypothetical protein
MGILDAWWLLLKRARRINHRFTMHWYVCTRGSALGQAMSTASELIAWAAGCRAAAESESDPDAKAAYEGLAAEFEAVELEIEGLIASFEALETRSLKQECEAA